MTGFMRPRFHPSELNAEFGRQRVGDQIERIMAGKRLARKQARQRRLSAARSATADRLPPIAGLAQ